MLFPDLSCAARETIQKLYDYGIYKLIGADWVAITTVSFRGTVFIDAFRNINGVEDKIPLTFLEENKDQITEGESLENILYQGVYILVVRFRAAETYACYNIYCRKDGPFDEKDICWLKNYSRANLEITQLKNENIQNQGLIDTIFDSISSAILALNSDGTILLSNQCAIHMFGLPVQYRGVDIRDYFDREATRQLMETMEHLMQENKKDDAHQLMIFSESAQKMFKIVMSPLKDSKEHISGVVMIANDITDQKMMELELEQLRQFGLLGEVAVGLAHDIKNPLMNILGCTKIALSPDCLPQTRDEVTHIIQYSANRIDAVVEQMLSYRRLNQHRDNDVDLNSIIQACVTMTERQKFDRQIDISLQLDPNIPQIKANSAHMQQIILNVLLNAVQAIEQSGTVRVSSQFDPAERTIQVVVEDNGRGIPEEMRESIFHPYVTTKARGTGLGLFIVKQTLAKYRGQIWITSKEGAGTKCTIQIPLTE